MPAFKQNLIVEQGATFDKSFLWKAGKPLVAVNMAGFTGRMQIRPTVESATIIYELTTMNGGLTLGSNGVVRMLIEADATALFSFTSAVYDLEIVSGTKVTRLMQGTVKMSPNVTR